MKEPGMDNGRKEILAEAVSRYGYRQQEDMCMEEMAELAKALLKYRRAIDRENAGHAVYHADYVGLHKNILEEMADVRIMLDQMQLIYGETSSIEEAKLLRLSAMLMKAQH